MADFSVWPCLASRLSHRVGGVPRALGLSFLVVGVAESWSARREGLQAGDRDGDLGSPGPGGGDAQPQPAAAAGQAPGSGEQAQPLGFPGADDHGIRSKARKLAQSYS